MWYQLILTVNNPRLFLGLFPFLIILLAQPELRPVMAGSSDSLEFLVRNTSDKREILRISLQLVDGLKNQYPDKALNYAREALEIANSLKDNSGRMKALT